MQSNLPRSNILLGKRLLPPVATGTLDANELKVRETDIRVAKLKPIISSLPSACRRWHAHKPCWWTCKLAEFLERNPMGAKQNLNARISYDLAILCLYVNQSHKIVCMYKHIGPRMFTEVHFLIIIFYFSVMVSIQYNISFKCTA